MSATKAVLSIHWLAGGILDGSNLPTAGYLNESDLEGGSLAGSGVAGNVSGAGNPYALLTGTQLTTLVNTFTTSLNGSVPAPGSVSGKVLSDNGTWVTSFTLSPASTSTLGGVKPDGVTTQTDGSGVLFTLPTSVVAATVSDLTNTGAAVTYANSSATASGVGATLTLTGCDNVSIPTIDGYAVISSVANTGDRLLIKNQTSAWQNGVYAITSGLGTSTIVLTRTIDSDTTAQIQGTAVDVQTGNFNANTRWMCTNRPGSALVWGTTGTATSITWMPVVQPGPGASQATAFSSSGPTSSAITLAWTFDTQVDGFAVWARPQSSAPGNWQLNKTGMPAGTGTSVSGLTSSTAYDFAVAGWDGMFKYGEPKYTTGTTTAAPAAFVQANSAGNLSGGVFNNSNPFPCTFSSSVNTHDIIYVAIINNASAGNISSVTDNQGNTYTQLTDNQIGAGILSTWWAKCGSSGSLTVTIHTTNTLNTLVSFGIADFTGSATSGFDNSAFGNGTGNSISVGPVSVGGSGELVVGASWSFSAPQTAGSGFTIAVSFNTVTSGVGSGIIEYKLNQSSAQSITATQPSGFNWNAAGASFAP